MIEWLKRFYCYWIQRLFVGTVENVTFTNCVISDFSRGTECK